MFFMFVVLAAPCSVCLVTSLICDYRVSSASHWLLLPGLLTCWRWKVQGVLNMLFTLFSLPQSIRPLEFMVNNDKLSIGFAEAAMYSPMVAKGSICKDMNVYPAECRGRRCSYKGRLVVSLRGTGGFLKKPVRAREIDDILRHNRLMSHGRSTAFLKASSPC